MKLTIRTRQRLPSVLPGEHGRVAEYVLVEERAEVEMAHSISGRSFPAGPVTRELDFEIMPGSKTESAILKALGLTKCAAETDRCHTE